MPPRSIPHDDGCSIPAPRALRAALPARARHRAVVERARHEIRDLLHGRDRRLLVVVGPCSIHDPRAALEYARRLARLARETRHALVLVMRTYFEKPRTRLGWTGLLRDPVLDGSGDLAGGLRLARELLLEIAELGLPCAAELLDPLTPPYLGDLLAWGAVGARTSESQIHRELASGLPLPVGFKNGTDGDVAAAVNGMCAAQRPHTCLGIDPEGRASVLRTRGNPDVHVVLRGGASGPNHDAETVARVAASAAGLGVARSVLVDCSHDNSGKDPARQPEVLADVVAQVRAGQRSLLGAMLESHLRGGRQEHRPGLPLEYGVSITDPCLGWEETERLLLESATSLARLGPSQGVGAPARSAGAPASVQLAGVGPS